MATKAKVTQKSTKASTKAAPAKKTTSENTSEKVTAKALSTKPVATKKVVAKVKTSPELQGLDRRGLAARARQLKTELLAIRFNLQSPSLKDYKKKKQELATVLSQLS